MIHSNINNAEIKEKIKEAIMKFLEKDKSYFLKYGVYEVAMSHRIAVYLEDTFGGYVVDCEYNKMGDNPKTNAHGKKVRPDIIIHKRGQNDNLVVVEVKHAGKTSKKANNDINKLRAYMYKELNYKIGVFVGVLKSKTYLCWVEKNSGKFDETWETL